MHAESAQPIRILLVDDHQSVVWGLEKLIESHGPDMKVVGKASSRAEALEGVERYQPDVVLLDLDLGEESGLDLLPLLQERTAAKVVILTGLRDPEIRERAVLGGARGLVHKTEPADAILNAITCVHGGEIWLDRATTARVFAAMFGGKARNAHRTAPVDALTAAERRVIAAVVKHKGAPCKVIADALHISSHTLRNHLASIYSKLDVHTRLDLVLYAMKNGLATSEH